MNISEKLFSKLIDKYSNSKQITVTNLENKKSFLKANIDKELEKFNELSKKEQNIVEKYKRYKAIYTSVITVLKAKGIIFDIPNRRFKVREWDNLYIHKAKDMYNLMNKSGESLYVIDKKYNNAIEEVIKKYNYSIVIVRMDPNFIKAQLRIVE